MKAKDLPSTIPTKFRITRKVTYEILYSDEILNGENNRGEIRSETKQIVLWKGQSPTDLYKTFLHECIHAVSDENGIKLTENQVMKLEEAVFRVLKLNKLLK